MIVRAYLSTTILRWLQTKKRGEERLGLAGENANIEFNLPISMRMVSALFSCCNIFLAQFGPLIY
jgi:hypothetical protein